MIYQCIPCGRENPVLRYDTVKNVFYNELGKRIKVKKQKRRCAYKFRIVLGRGCNLDCAYCKQRHNFKKSEMRPDEFFIYFKRFLNSQQPPPKVVA